MNSSRSCAPSSSMSGRGANQTGCSKSNAFIPLQANDIGYMLIRWRLLFVCAFPAGNVPNFETTAATDEGDFAFQPDLAAKFFRQNEATLFVSQAMLGTRMQLAQKNAAFAGGDSGVVFGRGAHAGELLWRHDKEKLVLGIGQKNKFFGIFPPPT